MAATATHKPAMGASKLGFTCECGQRFPLAKDLQEHINEEKVMAEDAKKTAAATKPEAPKAAAAKTPTDPVADIKEARETLQANDAKPEPANPGIDETPLAPAVTSAPSAGNGAPRATSKVQKFLDNADVRSRFENLLDKRAGQFITSLTALVSTNTKLQECSPQSFLAAAVTAAALDLPVNPNLGFAYIIPYNDKKLGMIAQFQMGYKGFIQLAQRSGQYKTIGAAPVYDGQLVDENPIAGNTYDWKAKKTDKIVGYVAYFKLLNGFEKDYYMSNEEAKKHGKRYSQSYRKGFGLWEDEFDTMATKTVLKLLISKFGPLTTDQHMQMAIERDQAVIGEPADAIDYPDNITELEQQIAEAPNGPALDKILEGVNVEDRKKLVPAVESRMAELSGEPF